MKNYILLAAVILLFSTSSTTFASHYGDTYGFSTKGMSLGNAMCARANEWDSVYYNIAGLGKTKDLENGKNQLAVAYQANAPDFKITINRKDKDGNSLPTNGDKDLEGGTCVLGLAFDTGLILDLPSFVSSARFGLGLGLNNDLTAVKINDIDPRTHDFVRYGRNAQRLVVLSGMGFGFFDDVIGMGFGVNSSFTGDGTVLLEKIDLDTQTQTPQGQAKMNMKIKPNILAGLYLSPGKASSVLEGLDLGFSYRQKTILDIYPFQTTGTTNVGQFPLNMMLALTDYFQPDMYTLGTAYATGPFVFSVDVEYQRWSQFRLSVPMTENFGSELSNFKDIYVPRLGVEYKSSSTLSLLFGYFYEPTFVPDSAVSGSMNFLDNDKHVGSVGFNLKLPKLPLIKGKSELTAGYQLQYLVNRQITKDDQTNPYNPNYSYKGICHTFMVGLNLNI